VENFIPSGTNSSVKLPASLAHKTFTPGNDRGEELPKRKISGMQFTDIYNFLGAGVASLTVSALLFGWFAPLQSGVGYVFMAFVLFLVFFMLLTSFSGTREEIKDRVATTLLYSAGIVLISSLLFVVGFTLLKSGSALAHVNFFTQTMQTTGPLDPLTSGGVLHAITGTLIQITIALAITIPLGITTAVFLNEVGGAFARVVRTVSDAMTALPSIVAGLFVFSALIATQVIGRSGLAASIAITVMMLPIVIRASDVVLRLVPHNLREASYALGSSKWRTVWSVVLPTSRSGLVTAVILGTARGLGETSPVLLTSGMSANLNADPLHSPMISLPLQVFSFIKSPEPNMIARGYGTAAVLLTLVLILFTLARLLGGKAPGQMSKRGQMRMLQHSKQDEMRFALKSKAKEKGYTPSTKTGGIQKGSSN
jgi:phosphate transport system permease protein